MRLGVQQRPLVFASLRLGHATGRRANAFLAGRPGNRRLKSDEIAQGLGSEAIVDRLQSTSDVTRLQVERIHARPEHPARRADLGTQLLLKQNEACEELLRT